jgi:hypothetical protein
MLNSSGSSGAPTCFQKKKQNLMKRIYMTLGLVAALGTASFAQKDINLAFSNYYPENNGSYDNVAPGDTFYFYTVVTNNGTVAVAPDDTIKIWYFGAAVGGGQDYWFSNKFGGYSIDPGANDTLGIMIIQGDELGMDGSTTVYFNVPTDATKTFGIEGYGMESDATPYNDPDVDQANPDGDGALTGDNHYDVTATFGTVGIQELLAGKQINLSVYPNPVVNGTIHFNYEFQSAAAASVRIMDLTGREVLAKDYGRQNTGMQSYSLGTAALSAGTYIIEFMAGNQKNTGKFTIQR